MLSAESHDCRRGGHPLVWGSKEAEEQDRYDHSILIPLLCCVSKFPFVSLETQASSRHLPFLCTVPVSSEGLRAPQECSENPVPRLWAPTLGLALLRSSLVSVQFSCSVVSSSLQAHGLKHARPPCPSPTPGACSNSCPSSR